MGRGLQLRWFGVWVRLLLLVVIVFAADADSKLLGELFN
jgi:hypothetical protein